MTGKSIISKKLSVVAATIASVFFCGASHSASSGDEWPTQPIEIVIPYNAGGAVDTLTRIVAKEMSSDLGQPIIVQPRPGGEGNIAAMAVARAKPDGYTLLSSSAVLTSIPVLFDNISWSVDDFAPIGRIATSSGFILASATLPVKTIPELVSYAKKNPGLPAAVIIGGAFTTYITHTLAKEAKLDLLFVPYPGAAQHMTDLYEGRVALATVSGNLACGSISNDKVNVLAITGEERSSMAPDIPTMAEAGYPAIDTQGWYGLHAPAGTPADRIARLDQALKKALATESVREALTKACVNVSYQNSEAFAKFVKQDAKLWTKAVALMKRQDKGTAGSKEK
ncbi:Bug family tripartite tricarboxylate transporter substrate binding protein [Pollutimonas harenae]|uniref:Tripartite tricarboxylate transporter substrate binding protein n=1 Tax=Pollutimonas harenae TaxID=657015 RepID=A0A853H512_9BURK|nr:tripartite tricarboxylate transporter substrate binding protein [Pollutimonas harenae]NYT85204.1 tripartite tricarboxylate transporter substrate binding protein [Pollutimonas harenae]TEA72422.1 tripartite tricarboxylate transporter substrate binding protein [Pollutimonas harenae]